MNKKAKIGAIERDERAIQLPIRLPLGKALAGLKATILEAIQEGNYALIDAFCRAKLLPLLEAQSELAYLKGGRRAELSAEKVVRESAVEFAPVKFSLGDDSDAQARGTIEYLRRISGIDPSKARSKFKRHIAGAIGDLSKEITSEVKKAVEDLTKQGIHLRGGKARIQEILARHNVQVTNTPALAETLFRTQSQQAYAAGRWNTVNDSDFGDYIWGFEYVTAGDDRVREGHRVLEGVRLPKEDPFWKKYFPPNGWNCRCTTLEIWKDEPTAKIDFGITGRDPRKRTPSAMNVPAEFRGNVGIFAAATPKTQKKGEFLGKNVANLKNIESIHYYFNENGDIITEVDKQQIEEEFDALKIQNVYAIPNRSDSNFSRLPEKIAHPLTYSEEWLQRHLSPESKEIKGRNLERCVCISPDGEIVGYNIGEDNRVRLSRKDRASLKGCYVCHSHPNMSPPSPADISEFFEKELQELSVVTRFGRYRIIRDENTVSIEEGKRLAKAYQSFVGKNVSHTEKLYLRLAPTQQEEYEKIVKAKYKGADGYMFLQLSMFEFIYDKLIRHFGNRLKIVYEEYNGK